MSSFAFSSSSASSSSDAATSPSPATTPHHKLKDFTALRFRARLPLFTHDQSQSQGPLQGQGQDLSPQTPQSPSSSSLWPSYASPPIARWLSHIPSASSSPAMSIHSPHAVETCSLQASPSAQLQQRTTNMTQEQDLELCFHRDFVATASSSSISLHFSGPQQASFRLNPAPRSLGRPRPPGATFRVHGVVNLCRNDEKTEDRPRGWEEDGKGLAIPGETEVIGDDDNDLLLVERQLRREQEAAFARRRHDEGGGYGAEEEGEEEHVAFLQPQKDLDAASTPISSSLSSCASSGSKTDTETEAEYNHLRQRRRRNLFFPVHPLLKSGKFGVGGLALLLRLSLAVAAITVVFISALFVATCFNDPLQWRQSSGKTTMIPNMPLHVPLAEQAVVLEHVRLRKALLAAELLWPSVSPISHRPHTHDDIGSRQDYHSPDDVLSQLDRAVRTIYLSPGFQERAARHAGTTASSHGHASVPAALYDHIWRRCRGAREQLARLRKLVPGVWADEPVRDLAGLQAALSEMLRKWDASESGKGNLATGADIRSMVDMYQSRLFGRPLVPAEEPSERGKKWMPSWEQETCPTISSSAPVIDLAEDKQSPFSLPWTGGGGKVAIPAPNLLLDPDFRALVLDTGGSTRWDEKNQKHSSSRYSSESRYRDWRQQHRRNPLTSALLAWAQAKLDARLVRYDYLARRGLAPQDGVLMLSAAAVNDGDEGMYAETGEFTPVGRDIKEDAVVALARHLAGLVVALDRLSDLLALWEDLEDLEGNDNEDNDSNSSSSWWPFARSGSKDDTEEEEEGNYTEEARSLDAAFQMICAISHPNDGPLSRLVDLATRAAEAQLVACGRVSSLREGWLQLRSDNHSFEADLRAEARIIADGKYAASRTANQIRTMRQQHRSTNRNSKNNGFANSRGDNAENAILREGDPASAGLGQIYRTGCSFCRKYRIRDGQQQGTKKTEAQVAWTVTETETVTVERDMTVTVTAQGTTYRRKNRNWEEPSSTTATSAKAARRMRYQE